MPEMLQYCGRRFRVLQESNLHAEGEEYLEFLEHHDFGFVQQILTFTHVDDGSLTVLHTQLQYLPFFPFVRSGEVWSEAFYWGIIVLGG